MRVKIKLLEPFAKFPTKAHPSDAGYDLYCSRIERTDTSLTCHTDVAFEIPEGYVGLLFPRSSVAKKGLILSNSVGVIDSCYRGEVSFVFKPILQYDNPSHRHAVMLDGDKSYNVGDRIGQIVIMPYPEIEFEKTDILSDTDRGSDGYGSSGN